jgi:hypothetical protein
MSTPDFESIKQINILGRELRVPRYPNITSLRGAAGSLQKPLAWRQMRQIASEDRFATRATQMCDVSICYESEEII